MQQFLLQQLIYERSMMEMKTVEVKRHTRSDTKRVRQEIAAVIEKQLPRIEGWINQIAEGIPLCNIEGKIQVDANSVPIWLVKPDPLAAFRATLDAAEYVIPKLSRSEQSVAMQVENVRVEEMSTPALQRRLLVALGLDAIASGEAIEVEAIPARQPDQSKP